MVLANIFKGAGEDAGAFISEIGKMSPSLKKLEDTRNETAKGFDKMTTLFVKLKNVLLRSMVPAFNESFAAMKPVGKWMLNNQGTVQALVKTVLAGVAAFLLFKTTLFVLSTAFRIASATATAFNVVQGITKALAGGSAFSLRKSRAALIAYNVTTKIATGVQAAFNAVLAANPIGLVIAGIVALIAVVAIIIKKWKSWGAALSILFGPLGFIISLIQSFRRNWDMLVKAFQQNGIIGAIKAIGVIILDALLMPVQQLLELAGKLPTWLGGAQATNAAGAIKELRKNIKGMQEDAKRMQDGQQPQQAQQTNPRAAQRENERRVVQESRENVRLDINDPGNLTQINRAQGGRRTRLQIGKTTAQ
jgi:Sec-independent protein translocase protein TatA